MFGCIAELVLRGPLCPLFVSNGLGVRIVWPCVTTASFVWGALRFLFVSVRLSVAFTWLVVASGFVQPLACQRIFLASESVEYFPVLAFRVRLDQVLAPGVHNCLWVLRVLLGGGGSAGSFGGTAFEPGFICFVRTQKPC